MRPLPLAQEEEGFYGWGGTSRPQDVSVVCLGGDPPGSVSCFPQSQMRRSTWCPLRWDVERAAIPGSEQRCEVAGSHGQGAGPDSGEAAGMTPAPASLGPGPVGHFRPRPERNFKSQFFFLPQVRSDLKMKK